MENKVASIFQIDHPAVKEVYQLSENYLISYHKEEQVDPNLCVVYFSSNELYYPNTFKAFENSILIKNKFEWQRNYLRKGSKHIFLRDVQKQWYIEGISGTLNSPEKLLSFLKKETNNYTTFFIGSSAGGFAALHYGSLLGAQRIYAFNAQLDLNLIIANSNASTDPLLFRYQNTARSEYFKIDKVLNDNSEIFYFQSSKSTFDMNQYQALQYKDKMVRVPFKTANHGFPFLRHNLSRVLAMNTDELKQLATQHYHPFMFSVHLDGWVSTISVVARTVYKRFLKKWEEKKASF
ncbi:hypothetical protein [Croceivirga sp. JEA036]|uniref:hypothetical protein n=1 Tax=Croceivirga sp. JEA036 TaxID=2721162 RepID=UPI0014397281|nr:hypothetical protein [Croceivirga sp. JEA036]NJB35394.1 hypothetical protein [Croceivirga sp. JEA036]